MLAFLLSEGPGDNALRARDKASGRALQNDATASSTDQLLRSFNSCSGARHSGHLPSLDRALRMQREQNVCEHDVNIGVV